MTGGITGGNNPLLDPTVLQFLLKPPEEGLINAGETLDTAFDDFISGKGLSQIFSQDVLIQGYYPPNLGEGYNSFFGVISLDVFILQDLTMDNPVILANITVTNFEIDDEGNVNTSTANSVVAVEINPWMAPGTNYLVAITMVMMEMARIMRLSRLVELEARLSSMTLIMEAAFNIGNAIQDAAEQQAKMYMIQGIAGCLQAAFGAISVGGGMVGGASAIQRGGLPANAPYNGWVQKLGAFMGSGFSTGMNSLGTGISQMISGFAQIGPTLEKGMIERYKEIQEGIKKLVDIILQSSVEGDKNLAEIVREALEKLKMIYEQALQAHKGLGPTQ
jgi:hypothetical protein